MKVIKTCIALVGGLMLMSSSCEDVAGVIGVADEILNDTTGTNPLTNEEVIAGLKQALSVGTDSSTASASKINGYNGNPLIRIPFMEDAQKVKEKALELGLDAQVEKFELTLNRAAEDAANEAGPIFLNAITSMSIADGFKILKGEDDAATQYLIDNTSAALREKFQPKIQASIEKVELTKYWNPIITKYNTAMLLTGGDQLNPNLDEYVTDKALEGLFILVAQEEKKIRENPAARVTDLLRRVFGSVANN